MICNSSKLEATQKSFNGKTDKLCYTQEWNTRSAIKQKSVDIPNLDRTQRYYAKRKKKPISKGNIISFYLHDILERIIVKTIKLMQSVVARARPGSKGGTKKFHQNNASFLC